MRELEEVLDDIVNAIDSGDASHLAALFLELNTAAAISDEFTDFFFARLLALLKSRAFLSMDESWKLTYFLDNSWQAMSAAQRETLRGVLTSVFDKHRNYMGAFVIGEVLGRQYADADALTALVHLSKTAQMPALALVPHGLETLARSTGDARLRDHAVQRLRELATSPIEQVRTEAAMSLGKVVRA